MTLIELVEHSSARLDQAGVSFGQGTTNAFDEAVWLVLWRLGLPLDNLDGVADRPLSVDEVNAVTSLIERRISTRQPAAYLTGEAWLQGLAFHVDERTIVPRSLIAEVLADGTLDHWLSDTPQRILDLCTGNGSLAVMAALLWPQAQVQGTDLSEQALEVARLNLERHDLASRIQLRCGDGLAAAQGGFDLVLCNPPYVNALSMNSLPPEFRAEPALALQGGDDGMDFIRHLLRDVGDRLATDDAPLVLEIGHERAHFDAAFAHLNPVWLPTSAGDDQVLLLTRRALREGLAP